MTHIVTSVTPHTFSRGERKLKAIEILEQVERSVAERLEEVRQAIRELREKHPAPYIVTSVTPHTFSVGDQIEMTDAGELRSKPPEPKPLRVIRGGKGKGKRKMTDAGRAAISKAAKKRWAAYRRAKRS